MSGTWVARHTVRRVRETASEDRPLTQIQPGASWSLAGSGLARTESVEDGGTFYSHGPQQEGEGLRYVASESSVGRGA
eukprot:2066819-Rhodomonas_salina.1